MTITSPPRYHNTMRALRVRDHHNTTGIHHLVLLFFLASLLVTTVHATIDQDRDICTLDAHCLNGGICKDAGDGMGHKHCHCADGYTGPRCNHYCPFDCKNGGYCSIRPQAEASGLLVSEFERQHNQDENYFCKCFGRFSGPLCETPYLNCGDRHRCYNGGTCIVNDKGIHECSCPRGYSGENCESQNGLKSKGQAVTKTARVGLAFLAISIVVLATVLMLLMNRRRIRPNFDAAQSIDYNAEHDFLAPTNPLGRRKSKSSEPVMLNVI